MADESNTPNNGKDSQPNRAPTDSAASPDQPAASPDQPAAASDIPGQLPDGRTPTVLKVSSGPTANVTKSTSHQLSRIYRRADVLTTVLTFVGTAITAGLILAGYSYFINQARPATTQPKLSQLEKSELEKLATFFGSGTPTSPTEILTINSSSLFKNRVALASDLKVIGGVQVSGPTALSDLVVDKVSTLGVSNIRGQLTVAGPTTLQSPAILAAGASVSGNVTVSGNGSFGGSLSAGVLNIRDLTVTGTINLAGHLVITGQAPSAAPASQAGSGATARVDGNDAAGTVTINTGQIPNSVVNTGGLLVTVTFRTPYASVPRVIITPIGQTSGSLPYYVQKTATGFTIGTSTDAKSGTGYAFDYWIVQ